MTDSQPQVPSNLFHAHIETCKQCHDNPMSLCPAGEAALRTAASGGNLEDFLDTVRERPSAMDIVGMAYGQSPEEVAETKRLAKAVLGPWAALI